ncbi:MAG TPA: transposase [Methanotrichaceae archaeon]|nr:transposase [Methanotrichaceae archaeon]
MKGQIEGDILHLDIDKLDLSNPDEIKALIRRLLSVIEVQAQIINELKEENQHLRDEIAYLKGEKGKPKIPPNVPELPETHPSDKPKKWKKGFRKPKIKIDRVEHRYVDKSVLPADAVKHGFRRVLKQNIKLETDNVEYILEQYYSPSTNKIYEAELPEDVKHSTYGSALKAFTISLHYAGRVTQNKIQKILEDIGIIISEGTIANILTEEKPGEFAVEKDAIFRAGNEKATYLQIDDTSARHMGKNHYLHVVCNDKFSSFFIMERRSKPAVRSIFGLNDDEKIDKPLVSDAAQQFFTISPNQGLCWIHEIRHYRKLMPILDQHKLVLSNFINQLWNFYDLLNRYKEQPDIGLKIHIEWLFDSLFLPETGYIMLDEIKAATRKRKQRLLRVLDFPMIPIHNNAAEIALREGVIKRKISYGTRSVAGKSAWENMLSILDTCRKLKVSFFKYIRDILSNSYSMLRLSQLIT